MSSLSRLSVSRVVLLGLFFAACYYLWLYDDATKITADIKKYKKEVTTLNKEEASLLENLRLAKQKEATQTFLEEKLKSMQRFVPEDLSPYEIISKISFAAKAAGVSIKKLNELSREKSDSIFFDAISIDVNLEGTYTQLVSFLSELSKDRKIYSLDSMKLSKKNKREMDSLVSFQGTIKGYKYKPAAWQ